MVGREVHATGTVTARSLGRFLGVELNDRELALVLAGLFELRITNLEDTAGCDAIDALAEKLGGGPVGDVLRRG